MKLSLRSLIMATALLCVGSVQASSLPMAFENQYISSALGFKITVTHSLTPLDDGTHKMHFRAESWFASIDETSVLKWDDAKSQVVPLHYEYKRRGVGKNRDASLSFDWQKQLVTNNVQDSSWKMDINQKVQDKLSYQLQLQQDLLDGKNLFSYQIADGGRLKEYSFEIVGEETLSTPLGNVETVKVKRSRENSDRVTYAWLAKKFDYLLVRMQQEEKGDTYTITLNKANVNGKALTSFN